jgi:hypothetical protein
MLRLVTGRKSGTIVHRLVAISGVNRVGDSDGLGVFMLGMMLFSVNFFVLLEILGSLEGLSTDFACMGFERRMNSEMTSDMVALRTGGCAVFPFASEAEVIGALPAYVIAAEMVVEGLRIGKRLCTVKPLTFVER